MNIKQLSYGLIGSLMMAGAFSSCENRTYLDKAKEQAVEYLDANELLKAERFEKLQNPDGQISAEAVTYWDSLITVAKVQEAYFKGQQLIKDSADGKFFKKQKYKAKLDTIVPLDLLSNLKQEYSNYTKAKDFIKARDNAPSDYHSGLYNQHPYNTHYWNIITIVNKENEAYQKGMSDARNELTKRKFEIPLMNSLRNK